MKSIVFTIAFFLPTLLYSQYSTKKGNSFPNGIYLNIDELKSRQPAILVSQILVDDEKSNNVKKWFRGDSLFYNNNLKIKVKYRMIVFLHSWTTEFYTFNEKDLTIK
ncbi:MAG: hypothetical protein IPK10_12970 [Bacteroidetes bacterium]|nr:hypothetical protein [Bacteroidota bacterium]